MIRKRGSKQIGRNRLSEGRCTLDAALFANFVSEELNEYIYVMNLRERKMEFISPAFERIWQCSPKIFEVPGTWLTLLHPEDRARMQEVIKSPQYLVAGHMNEEYRVVRPDGSVRWVHARSQKYFDKEGSPTFRIGIGADVTEQKNAQLALTESNRMLEERNRELDKARRDANAANQAKSDFLSTISHEIRTPVHAISGTSQLLLRSNLDPEQKRRAETILDRCEGLLGVVNDFLDFGKIESGQFELIVEPFSIVDVVEQSMALFSAETAGKTIALRHNVDPTVPRAVLGDGKRLGQILINLISNAVKFTENGFISVDVKTAGTTSSGESLIRISVTDTGIGIPPEKQKAIFEPFVQAGTLSRACRTGTGLGLSIVERLVTLMKGRVSVTSNEGKGSCFQIVVPLIPLPEPERAITDFRKSRSYPCGDEHFLEQNLGKLKVLVADDNPVGCRLACEMLREIGVTAESATNGRDVLDAVERSSYDVVLLDVQMPDMDGLETAREISKRFEGKKKPTLIALTAYARTEDRQRCLESGMDDYMAKPVDICALADKLAAFCRL